MTDKELFARVQWNISVDAETDNELQVISALIQVMGYLEDKEAQCRIAEWFLNKYK